MSDKDTIKNRYRLYLQCESCLLTWSKEIETELDLNQYFPRSIIDGIHCCSKGCECKRDNIILTDFDDLNFCDYELFTTLGFGKIEYFK